MDELTVAEARAIHGQAGDGPISASRRECSTEATVHQRLVREVRVLEIKTQNLDVGREVANRQAAGSARFLAYEQPVSQFTLFDHAAQVGYQ